MPLYLGSTALNNFRVGTETPDRIFLGNELVWPSFTEVTQFFGTAGAFTFNIPPNCRFLDIVVIGGGGGGQASLALFNYGAPGAPGSWAGVTLKRGVDIPWSVTQITGNVGGGGLGGPGPSVVPGFAGADTTATFTGGPTITGNAGAGGIGWASSQANSRGKSPGNFTFNGKLYVGGAAVTANNQPGNPPGGSGSGSAQLSSGSNGAPGGAWVRAY
ncbi:hypothetical protein SEA_PHRANNY_6 [Mycobacterium phage Phranny]|nr:hypothetical protein SEA_PHRANNY_6 [Mycobacterium phage Phranny]AXH44785.1 hypothetical protein SEA_REBA_6 [Mycobacterium phage Reba]QFP95246.1 hypothetical protein SEA_JEPPNRM_6 [Mycobacterium phage JeppNRM]